MRCYFLPDSDDESDGGVKLKINSEYAKRFEHNKKREELHRCEYIYTCAATALASVFSQS